MLPVLLFDIVNIAATQALTFKVAPTRARMNRIAASLAESALSRACMGADESLLQLGY
jgi:hypothetical protein